jgi:hypothetical protein
MTIKTQNGKVITKDGKVSCECCGFCCFYPAQALADGNISIDDLPDSVQISILGIDPEINGIYTTSKNNPPLTDNSGSLVYYGNPDSAYIYFVEASPNSVWFGAFGQTVFESDWDCLTTPIDFGPLGGTGFNIDDFFANSYIVAGNLGTESVNRKQNETDSRGRIYRSCSWSSQNYTLSYNSFLKIPSAEISGLYKWTVNGNPKIGNQDTPVGSYAGGFSVS